MHSYSQYGCHICRFITCGFNHYSIHIYSYLHHFLKKFLQNSTSHFEVFQEHRLVLKTLSSPFFYFPSLHERKVKVWTREFLTSDSTPSPGRGSSQSAPPCRVADPPPPGGRAAIQFLQPGGIFFGAKHRKFLKRGLKWPKMTPFGVINLLKKSTQLVLLFFFPDASQLGPARQPVGPTPPPWTPHALSSAGTFFRRLYSWALKKFPVWDHFVSAKISDQQHFVGAQIPPQ